MAEHVGKPKVRFAGFTEVWEQRNTSYLGNFFKGQGYSKADLLPVGTPIILYGQLYTNYQFTITEVNTYAQKKKNTILSKGNEVIVPASGETAEDIARASAVRKKGVILGGDLNIIVPIPSMNAEFFALSLSNGFPQKKLAQKAQGKSVVHIHNSDIQEISITYPSLEEQNRIASFFRYLDHLITLHQRKRERLENIKKAMLEKMFPKNGADVPEVRFAGFTEAWEQRKLGEIADKVTEKNTTLRYTEALTNSAEFGIIGQRDFFDHDVAKLSSLYGYYIVKKDDFVYNPRISVTAPVGPVNRNKLGKTGVVSPLYTVLRTAQIDNEFLEWFFKSACWHSFMIFNGDSGARSDRFSIKNSTFFEMPIPCPCRMEQARIGTFFRHLNRLITLHQRKVELLQNIKKACLEAMFA